MTESVSNPSVPAVAPGKYGAGARVFAQLLLAVAFIAIGIVIGTIFFYVPLIQKDVQDHGLEVGSLTDTTFEVSRLCHEYWYLAVGGYLVVFTVATFTVWSRSLTAKAAIVVGTACFVVSLFFGISFLLGVIEAFQMVTAAIRGGA